MNHATLTAVGAPVPNGTSTSPQAVTMPTVTGHSGSRCKAPTASEPITAPRPNGIQ
ncbi:hypothetical protein ACIBW9_10035 [Streptomyces sp. NPDC049541]|uniref:hypothetical protein n=1 Tax=Streptomyces sp. NPDC049541 TaxID=3365594 RepID=UPI00379774B2